MTFQFTQVINAFWFRTHLCWLATGRRPATLFFCCCWSATSNKNVGWPQSPTNGNGFLVVCQNHRLTATPWFTPAHFTPRHMSHQCISALASPQGRPRAIDRTKGCLLWSNVAMGAAMRPNTKYIPKTPSQAIQATEGGQRKYS